MCYNIPLISWQIQWFIVEDWQITVLRFYLILKFFVLIHFDVTIYKNLWLTVEASKLFDYTETFIYTLPNFCIGRQLFGLSDYQVLQPLEHRFLNSDMRLLSLWYVLIVTYLKNAIKTGAG